MRDLSIPVEATAITPEWLTAALQESARTDVATVEVVFRAEVTNAHARRRGHLPQQRRCPAHHVLQAVAHRRPPRGDRPPPTSARARCASTVIWRPCLELRVPQVHVAMHDEGDDSSC